MSSSLPHTANATQFFARSLARTPIRLFARTPIRLFTRTPIRLFDHERGAKDSHSLTSSAFFCWCCSTRYELPKPMHFGYQPDIFMHYSKLLERGVVYREDCMNHL
jgi:hypothetical protein